jgi:hypothetical protein
MALRTPNSAAEAPSCRICAIAGARVQAVILIPNTTGNVPITFGAMSYAGTLRLTVLSDPALVADAGC